MKKKCILIIFLFLNWVTSIGFAQSKERRPLSEQPFKEIIKKYTFISDFSQKMEKRDISEELFWKYPFQVPDVNFSINTTIEDLDIEFPPTKGGGRDVEHLNHARVLFKKNDFENARKVLQKGRRSYGRQSKFLRRTEYLIGLTYLKLGEEKLTVFNQNYHHSEVKKYYSAAASYLSLALIRKQNIEDPMFKGVVAKGLYNLAAIYYTYGKHAAAYGAATEGLNNLRKFGLKRYRSEFHRMVAESWIRNRSYFKAVQELDIAIRQDISQKSASAAFARVGDIYFDLNNYSLAEDSYGLSNAIDRKMESISPTQLILRGESLFWLGQFSKAQKMLNYGVQSINQVNSKEAPEDFASWAQLRIADAYLAIRSKLSDTSSDKASELVKRATLDYFKVETKFPKSEAAKIAKIRRACLELPYYKGKNVRHARELLTELKDVPLASEALELAWACRVGSYADRERTNNMLDRVRAFAGQYPKSRFLKSLVTPVVETQNKKFFDYIEQKKHHMALSFFETNRSILYKKISNDLSIKLFELYVDVNNSKDASEFWPRYKRSVKSPSSIIRSIVFINDSYEMNLKNKSWMRISKSYAKKALDNAMSLEENLTSRGWLRRIIASRLAEHHFQWIANLIENWSKKSPHYRCEMLYPIYAKMIAKSRTISIRVKEKLGSFVNTSFPDLLNKDENCSQFLLDLEEKSYANKKVSYSQKWLSRFDWPMTQSVVAKLWIASERLLEDKKNSEAIRIWQHIRDNSPKELPEWKFAKIRLDPNRTEFEGLWE